MCYLTALGQKKFKNADIDNILYQIAQILRKAINRNIKPKRIHVNFMARGEPLTNPYIFNNLVEIEELGQAIINSFFPEVTVKFIISTILPKKNIPSAQSAIFKTRLTTFYYSLYSTKQEFRKKWLPNAASLEEAKVFLSQVFDYTGKHPRVHFCFIKDQNDSLEDLMKMCEFLNSFNFKIDVNIVRYNPFSEKFGEESSRETIDRNIKIIEKHTKSNVKIINRVGYDVSASCGMFINDDIYYNR